MKKSMRRTRRIAFCLALILCCLQILGTERFSATKTVRAANGPEYLEGITATGAAIAVDPTMTVPDIAVAEVTTTSIKFQWVAVANATQYYLYRYNELTDQYEFLAATSDTSYSLTSLPAGEAVYLTMIALNDVTGSRSGFAAAEGVWTKPEKMGAYTYTARTTSTLSLKWDDLNSATGYVIYRAGSGGNFKQIATCQTTTYQDMGLDSGKTYQYKIAAYAGSTDNLGEECAPILTSTLPDAPTLTVKGGNERIRLTWDAITGATGYTIYILQDGQYVPLTVLEGKTNKMFIHKDLTNGQGYEYFVTAYRTLEGVNYESAQSQVKGATPAAVAATSTKAKLFATKSAFNKSEACTKNKEFKKKVNYKKSFVIPGMINTNVAEFTSYSMVPQAICFVKSYLMITAYDANSTENSVIYVLKKSNKKLMTTIVLPNKAHAGGLAFDGKNLWITQSKTLKSIPYSQVKDAIADKEPYVEVSEYATDNALEQQAGSVMYYKNLLWVASYDELKPGYLVSYKISNKSDSPSLTALNTISLPTRVQGFTITSNGRLILSRSCQTNSTKRGFMHQLDVYKPNLKKASKGIISLGKVRNTIAVPSMNEGVAVSGSYMYVIFESVYFGSAVERMDRVCALPVSYVTKLKK